MQEGKPIVGYLLDDRRRICSGLHGLGEFKARFLRPRVDAVVEPRQVHTGRKRLGADRVPVAPEIDVVAFGDGHQPDVLRGQSVAGAVGVIDRVRDAVLRRSTGVAHIVRVAALFMERERQTVLEVSICHKSPQDEENRGGTRTRNAAELNAMRRSTRPQERQFALPGVPIATRAMLTAFSRSH